MQELKSMLTRPREVAANASFDRQLTRPPSEIARPPTRVS